MNLPLNQGHPSFALSNKVSEISKDFMDSHHFNFFIYLRCYPDGSFNLLINNPTPFLKYLEEGHPIFSSLTKEIIPSQSYTLYWEDALNEKEHIKFIKEHLNLHHGIHFVKRYKDFYDLIAFTMPTERPRIFSYYLTHHYHFEQFTENFLKKGKDIFKAIEKDKILLPPHLQDPNKAVMCLDNQASRFNIVGKLGPTYLTNQELLCLQLLSKGKTYKEIALRLSISPRTVETYLKRIKEKTGFSSKNDYFSLFSQ